jgi:hypothetical protein
MATVRAKFFVQEITRRAHNPNGVEVTLSAVSRGKDNTEWASYTPSGQIKMTILNEVASSQFELGDEFYVDFTPCPKGNAEGMNL